MNDLDKAIGVLDPTEFRRVVAALNALAVSLPAIPETCATRVKFAGKAT